VDGRDSTSRFSRDPSAWLWANVVNRARKRESGISLTGIGKPLNIVRIKEGMVHRNSRAGAVSRTRRSVPSVVSALLACAVILVAGYQNKTKSPVTESPKPATVSKLRERIQITNDGVPKDGLVADRSRLYLIEHPPQGPPRLQAFPIAGGPGTVIDVAIPKPVILDVSPDSELLVSSGKVGPGDPPLWVVPASGGIPRRLGQIRSTAAA
jgi:hypothetical protein